LGVLDDGHPGRCPGLDWGRAVGAPESGVAGGFISGIADINLDGDGGRNQDFQKREFQTTFGDWKKLSVCCLDFGMDKGKIRSVTHGATWTVNVTNEHALLPYWRFRRLNQRKRPFGFKL
jgi:hypothetical protein